MEDIAGNLRLLEEEEIKGLLKTGLFLIKAQEECPWVAEGITEPQWLAAGVGITRRKANLAMKAYMLLGEGMDLTGMTMGKVKEMLPVLDKLMPDIEKCNEIIAMAQNMPFNDFRDALRESKLAEHECKFTHHRMKEWWECEVDGCNKRTYINPEL